MTCDCLTPIGKASYCPKCHQMLYPSSECICDGKNPHIKEKLEKEDKARDIMLKKALNGR